MPPPRRHGDNGGQVDDSLAAPLLSDRSGGDGGGEEGPAPRGRHESESDSSSSPERTAAGASSTAALAVAMMVQSYLLVGVFPYAGFLAMHLVPSLDEETAGRCAGLIASSFMAGRTLTSFCWGKAADRYGRTFAIEASLLLSAVFSVLFGLAPSLPLALAARFALGLGNGLIGSVKTIITEMSRGDKPRETKIMAVVMGMWGYGFLINPAMGGYLADPVKQYPDSRFVEVLDSFLNLTGNPFLLPNLAGCAFCLLACLSVRAFVEETLPIDRMEPFEWNFCALLPSFCKRTATATGGVASSQMEDQDEEERPATIRSLWRRESTRKHLVLYWAYSFVIISIDETFPLYCISKNSGLGVEEKVIGNLLSGTGVVYVLVQFCLLTGLVDRYGFYKSMRIGALCSVPLACLIPLSLLTNRRAPSGTVTWTTIALLSVVYATMRACSSVTFSTLTMTTNRTVPAHQRAAMNGLSMLGGSLAKAAGPAFAGVLFSTSVGRIIPPMGSVVVWSIIACLGLCVFVQTLLLPEHNALEVLQKPRESAGSVQEISSSGEDCDDTTTILLCRGKDMTSYDSFEIVLVERIKDDILH